MATTTRYRMERTLNKKTDKYKCLFCGRVLRGERDWRWHNVQQHYSRFEIEYLKSKRMIQPMVEL